MYIMYKLICESLKKSEEKYSVDALSHVCAFILHSVHNVPRMCMGMKGLYYSYSCAE